MWEIREYLSNIEAKIEKENDYRYNFVITQEPEVEEVNLSAFLQTNESSTFACRREMNKHL
jgi:hypothetical protein